MLHLRLCVILFKVGAMPFRALFLKSMIFTINKIPYCHCKTTNKTYYTENCQVYYLQKTFHWPINITQSTHDIILPTQHKNSVYSFAVYFSFFFKIISNFQRANICKLFHVCLSALPKNSSLFK